MKILVIGDTHARTKFLHEYYKLSESLNAIADKLAPDKIILLGDDLHNHSSVHSLQLKAVTDLILKLSQIAPVYKLIGNHEIISPNNFCEGDHHFHSLKSIDNITIIDNTLVEEGLLFVPYVPKGMFKEAVKHVDFSKINMCFAHQEFRGVIMGSNHESTSDDTYTVDLPPVISGHIHMKQQINNIHYVGSPHQITFADALDRYVALVDNGVIDYIKVEGITQYKTFELDLKEDIPESLEYNKNDRNRLLVYGSLTDYKSFRSSKLFKKLSSDKFIIVPKVHNDKIEFKKSERKTFQSAVNELLTDDLKEIWKEIL